MHQSTDTAEGASRHAHVLNAGLLLFTWGVAAAMVIAVPHGIPSTARSLAQAFAIVAGAFLYHRLTPVLSLDRALLTGVAWLLLSVATEMVVTAFMHHPWFELLGSPTVPGLRGIQFVAWLVGPALFARGIEA